MFRVLQLVSACRWSVGAALFLTAPSALHEVCLWSVGFFSLVLLFHLRAWTAAHKLFMWCHVKELLPRLPAGTARACVCVWRVSCILYKLEYCVKLCVMPVCVCVCVCVCCNSHSKSKSLTAALMPAASQVMKGPLLVATDTSITATPPPSLPLLVDGESITPSVRHSVSLTLACIIKVYFPGPPSSAPCCDGPPSPQKKKINMKWSFIFQKTWGN